MSGILRAAAPLARRLNAVPKGPIAQQTRGMACECPERRAVSYLPPSHPGLDYPDPNAPPKVAYPWLDPTNPQNWKEEHLVFTILGGWGVVIMGAKSAFS
ncbi:predicted protein [Micromonas commoda]|uniref:Uncharacterized protein n=1 Tax=Micromonas commoda (strain RCC299 / NOUM17 / CCMP2709) TaxID=296587 RepID=C1E6H5_MICCC|nr:predicted protein [Micromonas commoda]ACO63811.1 predicted protein [Micromonas commoda]|eukprot:XP_002502553.1 predicted protein [Micromonas commoda]